MLTDSGRCFEDQEETLVANMLKVFKSSLGPTECGKCRCGSCNWNQ